jgi:hypothetical protein
MSLATPRVAVDGEALLRERLTPAQLADYEANAAFNVRGSNDRLYRVYADVRVGHCNVHDGRMGRTAYVHDSIVGDAWDGYGHEAIQVEDWEAFNASCIKLMIEVNPDEFERKACDQPAPFDGPADFDGFYADRGELRLTTEGSVLDPVVRHPEPPAPEQRTPRLRDARGRFLGRLQRPASTEPVRW